jgi:hypothetical protein
MRTIEARICSWKGDAVQRAFEPGSRGIAIARAVNRKGLVKTLQARKDSA